MTRAKNYNQFLTERLLAVSQSAELMVDFGAGLGTIADELRKRGRTVMCIEPDAALNEYLRTRNFSVFRTLGDLPSASISFIYSLNVLEHIEDDYTVLAEMYSRLEPGGRLYLYVPAFQILFSSMDRKVGHFRRYQRGHLSNLLRAVGLKPLSARYVDSLGFLATLVYRLVGSRYGDLPESPLATYDRYCLPLSLRLDRLLFRCIGKNLEILAIK